jgi:hypothetical protein
MQKLKWFWLLLPYGARDLLLFRFWLLLPYGARDLLLFIREGSGVKLEANACLPTIYPTEISNFHWFFQKQPSEMGSIMKTSCSLPLNFQGMMMISAEYLPRKHWRVSFSHIYFCMHALRNYFFPVELYLMLNTQ